MAPGNCEFLRFGTELNGQEVAFEGSTTALINKASSFMNSPDSSASWGTKHGLPIPRFSFIVGRLKTTLMFGSERFGLNW